MKRRLKNGPSDSVIPVGRRSVAASISIVDQQFHCHPNRLLLRKITRALCSDLLAWTDYEVSVVLLDPFAMSRLNYDYLRHHGSTDVITFNYSESPAEFRGEIFISICDALEHADRFRRPWQEELIRYIVHGALHLAGHDDLEPAPRRAMKRQENKLLKALSQRFDLRKL